MSKRVRVTPKMTPTETIEVSVTEAADLERQGLLTNTTKTAQKAIDKEQNDG